MIVYMLDKNGSLYNPIHLTFCLYLAIDNDLVHKSTRLSENQICFTSIFDPNSSLVKKTLVKCA